MEQFTIILTQQQEKAIYIFQSEKYNKHYFIDLFA